MRFVLGPPPDTADFFPERDGWQRILVPSPRRLVIIGSAIGLPLCAVVLLGWLQLPSSAPIVRMDLAAFGPWGAVIAPLIMLLSAMISFVGLIGVHELIHVLACPGLGMSSASVIGVWPSRMLPYGDYQGALPCWRCIVVAMAPLTILSLVPLAVASILGQVSTFWMAVSIVNALVCGGDKLLCFVVAWQVPLSAVVRNKQWDTWWRPARPAVAAEKT